MNLKKEVSQKVKLSKTRTAESQLAGLAPACRRQARCHFVEV